MFNESLTLEFQKLYDTIDEAARFEDKTTLKFAIDNRYHYLMGYEEHFGTTICTYAAKNNNLFLLKILHNLGVEDLDYSSVNTILVEFCENGNLEGVKFAVEDCGESTNSSNRQTGCPAHYYAAKHGYYEICKYLCSFKQTKKYLRRFLGRSFVPIYDIILKMNSGSSEILELLKLTDEENAEISELQEKYRR
ncbi:hypothetical protein TVAG_262570 [Trichomonas vaginalis G3]|uniref:Uncharacterized protein n=1 Tax=Trichomonas vaginalis (strain ATCC PRA-98 / G3) TaxID=412133 RepID=A2DUG9_TRIV3|nr:protein ubiquitination [Trichomonas vaginalis G3]EAY16007.1 hypothetical protein TVAG_262570 [Trichomonas vaginalis G3]KAI5523552.1 protein ubiquitination [Trichomonas vaginalis G3]|eukprot:XP_001328230.1 hypothetical protein [Trichomonas vaginalis G3]